MGLLAGGWAAHARASGLALPRQLGSVVDESHLHELFEQGIIDNKRARWVEQFFAKRTKAWWLSFVIWHSAEHLYGEALCVRSQAGIALGI
jgi:hypothetical protein